MALIETGYVRGRPFPLEERGVHMEVGALTWHRRRLLALLAVFVVTVAAWASAAVARAASYVSLGDSYVAAVLQGIRARSPSARGFVVNYPAIFPETGNGCWPQVPIAFRDVPSLRAKQQELNQMLATQAAANGATLVSWYAASIGHDSCKSSSVRWVEPLVPGNVAAPIHPNRNGMQGAANVLVPAVQG